MSKPRMRALSPFVVGLSSTLDIAGLGTYRAMRRAQLGTARVHRESDWQAVGRDLSMAMTKERANPSPNPNRAAR